jgi:molybdenum cofactor cytidylyltransferase
MRIGALILAAGESRRFEGVKQLVKVKGQTLLNRVLKAYKSVGCSPIYVALGANCKDIAETLPEGIHVIHIQDWFKGMGHSLATSIAWIDENESIGCKDKLLVGLGDQVDICSEELNRLINRAKELPSKIIAASYNDSQGVPAIFGRADLDSLSELQGDVGARVYLKNNSNKVIPIDLPSAAFDIDTRNDLHIWQQSQQN